MTDLAAEFTRALQLDDGRPSDLSGPAPGHAQHGSSQGGPDTPTPTPADAHATGAAVPARQHHVAGGGPALQALRELIGWPHVYAQEGAALGVSWPRGLLLHGPPGCGKTLMVQAVAEEYGAALHTVSAADVFGPYMGQSERALREAFEAAARDAARGQVAVVFLDEVDALCPRRDGQRAHESRVVAQLLTLIDGAATAAHSAPSVPPAPPPAPHASGGHGASGLSGGSDAPPSRVQGAVNPRGHLVVVGATNRPDALDPALRRPGRLDREVAVPTPDTAQRTAILQVHLAGLQLHSTVDIHALAESCHGYSGADLAALAREAALMAVHTSPEVQPWLDGTAQAGGSPPPLAPGAPCTPMHVVVTQEHVSAAMRRVGPSIVRGAEAEVPPTRWDDIGGLDDVKRRLQQCVEWPLKHRDAFQRLGVTPPRGVLLYGPPGCSKTSLARAAASASGATLVPLSCAQLFSMYVGEGEALLRDVFRRARLAAPAIVLLDEVDAVAARRVEGGDGSGGGGEAGVRLLTTLLTEMDGVEDTGTGVLVLGATNRPQAVDAALMRPGRFDALLYVPPPDTAGRLQVLRVHTRAMPLAPDVDLSHWAAATHGWTGAELAGLCREAALAALREDLHGASCVSTQHFTAAKAGSRAPATSAFTLAALENWAAGKRGASAGAATGLH